MTAVSRGGRILVSGVDGRGRALSESSHAACRRIDLARLARRFPRPFALLATGEISLSLALAIKPALTEANQTELLAAARGKSPPPLGDSPCLAHAFEDPCAASIEGSDPTRSSATGRPRRRLTDMATSPGGTTGFFVAALGVTLLIGCPPPGHHWDRLGGDPQGFRPFFFHQQVFVEGQYLSVAVDPNRYPSKLGQTYGIHVVNHKTSSEWESDPSLVDVTGVVETSTLVAGDMSGNTSLAWAGMQLPSGSHVFHRGYDIVADFDRNGRYDPGVDILDLIGLLERAEGSGLAGGFALVRDPADPGDFPVSTHDYDLGSFSVAVDPAFEEPGDPVSLALLGRLYYPSVASGADQGVSPDWPSYPLVIIAHGRSTVAASYRGYEYLGRHLASRGFICASVSLYDLTSGWRMQHRAVTIVKHVTSLMTEPTTDAIVADVRTRADLKRVGLLGHSRGGEAVVAAQGIVNAVSPPAFEILATAAFSPTDGANFQDLAPSRGPHSPAGPYLMIYGTHDSDLWGSGGNTGIRVVDRAPRPRHLIGVYGANHNFFNEVWPTDGTPTITATKQRAIAKALVTAFFTNHLWDAQAYAELFSGWVRPGSVTAGGPYIVYGDQPSRWAQLTVDNAEDSPQTPTTNSLGATNSGTTAQFPGLATFDEERLSFSSQFPTNHYFHGSRALRAAWNAPGSFIAFEVGDRNVAGYEYLGFRVAQRYRAPFEPIPNFNPPSLMMSVSVSLSDAHGNTSPPIRLDALASGTARVQVPDTRSGVPRPKTILQAVRIPLLSFKVGGAIDLTRVTRVTFAFDTSASGELVFDDVEFLGLNITSPEVQ